MVKHQDGSKIAMTVRSKSVRDYLCLKLKESKLKPSDVRVQAQMTYHQRTMKRHIWSSISSHPHLRMALAADVVELRADGQKGAHRIPLSFDQREIDRLLELVKGQAAPGTQKEGSVPNR